LKRQFLFYSRLKGIPKANEKEATKQSLEQVKLDHAAEVLVSQLSGGMRRRLSIAIALVGSPYLIFLDEPTTGLDPDTRREIWNVLLRIKQGKCVVLTTHSMEEADILCTRIGIMSKGLLKAIGSNVRLKNKFGEGYSLKLNVIHEKEEEVIQLISKILPEAELVDHLPGSLTFRVSKNLKMSQLLTDLSNFKGGGISDWGLSQTTLEDVFLNIVKKDEHVVP